MQHKNKLIVKKCRNL